MTMMDNTIAWMVAKPVQDRREHDLRESAEARELRTILATAQPTRPTRTAFAALTERLWNVVSRTPSEPSCCPA
jgi:hypothetical protein